MALSMEPSTLPFLDAEETTWASRNPGRATQKPHENPRRLTDAQKATRAVATRANAVKTAALNADIDLYLSQRDAEIQEIATKHSQRPEHILRLVNHTGHFKPKRAPTLQNAKAHHKAKELNEDLLQGERIGLMGVKEQVAADPELQNLTKAQEQELLDELIAHRELKKTGARPSNRAAAVDVRNTAGVIGREIEALEKRTGCKAFAFFTRTNVNDAIGPTFVESANATDFIRFVLRKDPWDLARLFEQFACAQDSNSGERDTLALMRIDCAKSILAGLQCAARNSTMAMNYANYDVAIVGTHHVKIVGWPEEIPFCNPSSISVSSDIRTLRDDLKSGACHWIRLSKPQIKAHQEELALRVAEGTAALKKRKTRSDKGSKKKKSKASTQENVDNNEDEAEGQAPRKKRKTSGARKSIAARLPPAAPKSREFITGSDDDEEEEEDSSAQTTNPPP